MTLTTTLPEIYCPDCRATTQAEAVPCVDGHAECHEYTCVDCGAAFLVGTALDEEDETPVRVASVA